MAPRDPLYQQIVERLAGEIDPQKFEDAAGDLLRDAFPSLVPIRGGGDSGRDGAIADGDGDAYPLLCTTSPDVIGNLGRSLDSYLKDQGRRRKVVLATTQALTPKRRTNLEERAREKGFSLIQIFERRGFADRLYRDAGWRKKLLELAGAPAALSRVPLSRRPTLELAPVGRDADLEWLRNLMGDAVLAGAPGSGKTFLFQHLLRSGWPGLFLESRDEVRIADALREQQSGFFVIVDDAHTEPLALTRLIRLRQEIGAEFSIVATTWEGSRDAVIEALGGLPPRQVRTLEPLSRMQVAEIYRQAGVLEVAPFVLRELADQAANKPGLAVTLALLWLRGAWEEVITGQGLRRNLLESLRALLGQNTTALLAAFSLGGDRGMSLAAVGRFLEKGAAAILQDARDVAAAGALFPLEEEVLCVKPRQLRSALIWEEFFPESRVARSFRSLLEEAPDLGSAAEALVLARWYGAPVPDSTLRELVIEADRQEPWRQLVEAESQAEFVPKTASFRAWQALASTNRANGAWALDQYPGNFLALAPEILRSAPSEIVPRLLERIVGSMGSTERQPSHPLRILERWLQEPLRDPTEALHRRKRLARAATRFLERGGDPSVALKVIALALSPRLEAFSLEPVMGNTIQLTWTLLAEETLTELIEIWDGFRQALESMPVAAWPALSFVLWQLVEPEHAAPGIDISAGARTSLRNLAEKVVRDLAKMTTYNPSLASELEPLAAKLAITLELSRDAVFDLLFPNPAFDESEVLTAAQKEELARQAKQWSRRDCQKVARQLERYEAEAKALGRNWPRQTPDLCRFLAGESEKPDEWLEAFAEASLPGDLAEPFLRQLIRKRSAGWVEMAGRWLTFSPWEFETSSVLAAETDLPNSLQEALLEQLSSRPHWAYLLSLRGELSHGNAVALLEGEKREASLAVAAGIWAATPKGTVAPNLQESWRLAILKAAAEPEDRSSRHSFGEILKQSPDLAFDWVLACLGRDEIPRHLARRQATREPFGIALSVLDFRQRHDLLAHVRPGLGVDSLLADLIQRDPALYQALLEREPLRDYHLAPLAGMPDTTWASLAMAAFKAGHTAEEMVQATIANQVHILWGSEVSYWTKWKDAFSKLENDPREQIREIARQGKMWTDISIRRAEREEQRLAREGVV